MPLQNRLECLSLVSNFSLLIHWANLTGACHDGTPYWANFVGV